MSERTYRLRTEWCMRCKDRPPVVRREDDRANYCQPCLDIMVAAQEGPSFRKVVIE